MKIALAQINTTVGDFEGTVRKIAAFVKKGRSRKADLIAFPELTLTGYPPRDLVEIPDFVSKNLRALVDVSGLARGIAIVVGYAERNERPGEKPLFNAAALCQDGVIVERYFKNLLPSYDVFDEGRYFEPGRESGLWNFVVNDSKDSEDARKIGISICEDSWNDKTFWETRLYPRDPIEEQVQRGSEFLLNLSASPYSLGKPKLRRDMAVAMSQRHGVPFLYVNLVGGNDELVFDGRSLAVNPLGRVVAEGKAYKEDLLVVDLKEIRGGQVSSSAAKPMSDMESVHHTLVLGLRDYVHKCGFKKVILGLSGGIDSSLTAVLAVDALGSRNVVGVAMPSPYSSRGSIEDARRLARNLKIKLEVYPIRKVYEAYRRLMPRKGGKGPPDAAEENIQARIRGNVLMTLSNRYGYLVLSTGNKSELAMGYCTLYGDMSGGLALISDIPKTMVYELSRFIQSKRPVIPEGVFTKPPSAELRPNQTDQDTLPPYEVLDPILKAAIEDRRSEEEIVRMGFKPKTVREVLGCIKKNEYKRRQAAPGIKVTSKAFGIGRRFPMARKM